MQEVLPHRPNRRAEVARGAAMPPALIVGGDANALSVARSLRRLGVRVYVISEPGTCVRYSRHCRWIGVHPGEGAWDDAVARYLLGPDAGHLRGAVLLACSDSALELAARRADALRRRYRLDLANPAAQLAMLDKLATYRHAAAAGVPTPRFWVAGSRADLAALRGELAYPLIVKPRVAHRAKRQFNRKHEVVGSFDELCAAFEASRGGGVEVLLVEQVPGGDEELCSYYTYLDEAGKAVFDFTKRVVRRYPAGMGLGSCHVTDDVPAIKELSLRLLRQAGLRGLAAVEFKRDPRDGQYKLIECNARFTAADALVAASGCDLGAFIYRRSVGLAPPPSLPFRRGMRLWDPVTDCLAFLELRRAGRLTLAGWLGSLVHRPTFAFFRWSDPLPALARAGRMLSFAVRAVIGRRGDVRAPAAAADAVLPPEPSPERAETQAPAAA